jgi:putative ABC transport system ATP-binding protein
MYELTDVHKYFNRRGETVKALDGLDLTIDDGEFLAIQGPTGQGKSTLLLLLGGLDRPTSGQVVFDDRDLSELPERELAPLRASTFGFVFQTFNLIPTLTAQENVETALVATHVAIGERHRLAREMLDELGLRDRADHLPSELSGGQQQRVAIARALVTNPAMILADEPTGALDTDGGREVLELFRRLHSDGQTILMVTHSDEVAGGASRIVHMRDGRIDDGTGHADAGPGGAGGAHASASGAGGAHASAV